MTPIKIIFVEVPAAASNKRVKNRPPSYQPIRRDNGQWPVHHPIPDARRHLDEARREIASSRDAVTAMLRSPGP